ncbi:unnamed protein product, partial [Medioppia subpectinata]
MSSSLFEHIRQLHSDELYTNLVQLMNLLSPQMDSICELFSATNEYKALVFFGDALYRTKDYRKAE